jgi:hypothetical protein
MRVLPRCSPWVRGRGSVQTTADQARPADRPPTRRRSRPQAQSSPAGWSRCLGNGSRAERYALGGSYDWFRRDPDSECSRRRTSANFGRYRGSLPPRRSTTYFTLAYVPKSHSLLAQTTNRGIVRVADEPKGDTAPLAVGPGNRSAALDARFGWLNRWARRWWHAPSRRGCRRLRGETAMAATGGGNRRATTVGAALRRSV